MTKLPEGLIATTLATTYTVELTGAGPHLDEFNEMLRMTVVRRGPGCWSIDRQAYCLSVTGEWDWGRSLDHEDDWFQAHWFTLDDAIQRAQAEALRMYENFLERT